MQSRRKRRVRLDLDVRRACSEVAPSSILPAMKLLSVALVLAAACGSKSPPATTPTPTPGGASATAVLPDLPFEELDHDQRVEFMKQKVLPTMKPLFQNHDPEDFAGFGCETCHGAGAKDGEYEMPNPKLPKLNLANLGKFKKADVEWMKNEILPTMARLLGEPVASEANPKGFHCLECHTEGGE